MVRRSDVAGAALWAVSLYYASPLQLLLLFLGRNDVERPSDETLRCVSESTHSLLCSSHSKQIALRPRARACRLLGVATGQPVDSPEYEAPAALRCDASASGAAMRCDAMRCALRAAALLR